jgi:hypothetical protein
MMNWSLLTGLLRVLGVSCVMGAICWKSAETAGPNQSEVIVHVTENGVEVGIDGMVYLIADRFDGPILCELNSGRHLLTMSRDGQLLYREEFSLQRGEQRVLTAWALLGENPSTSCPSPEQPYANRDTGQ